jgi:tetratricopeptide (TPR) repeat protein
MKQSDFRAVAIVVLGLMALPGIGYAAGTSSSSESAKPDLYKQAEDLIDDEEYADALNLLGYANRKLGDKSKAMTYYTKALNLEPNHLGANEYMGELYLEMNDLPKAEERLAILKNACGDCDEFDDLEDEIENYKEAHGLS